MRQVALALCVYVRLGGGVFVGVSAYAHIYVCVRVRVYVYLSVRMFGCKRMYRHHASFTSPTINIIHITRQVALALQHLQQVLGAELEHQEV